MYTYLCTKIIVLYELSHMISKDLDGGATEADDRASAPVGPSVATPPSPSLDHTLCMEQGCGGR